MDFRGADAVRGVNATATVYASLRDGANPEFAEMLLRDWAKSKIAATELRDGANWLMLA